MFVPHNRNTNNSKATEVIFIMDFINTERLDNAQFHCSKDQLLELLSNSKTI